MIASLSTFTEAARAVLTAAQDEARSLGHGYIGTEHLLIAILSTGDGPRVAHLRAAGLNAEAARQAARDAFEATGRANPYIPDADVLGAVGVDLGEVRRRAEATFGPGSIPGRVGAPPFTPRAAMALRHTVEARGAEPAGPDDLVVGLIADPESIATKLITASGVALPVLA